MDKNTLIRLKWIRKELDKGLVIEAYLDRVIKEAEDGIQSDTENNSGEEQGTARG